MASKPRGEDDGVRLEWDLADAGESQRIEREIITRIWRGGYGKSAAVVAEELRGQFAAAAMPQAPEEVQNMARAITEYRWPALNFLGQLTDIVIRRRIPAGLLLEEYRLPGDRWVPVLLVDTTLTRSALGNFRRVQRLFEQRDASATLAARLISMPGPDGVEQVAVMLRSIFAGTLAPESASALVPAVEEADEANRQLMVDARFDEAGSLTVLIPD